MIKTYSSNDQHYDQLLEGASERVLEALSANRMTAFQVLLRYSDNCLPGESLITWLETVEYPETRQVQTSSGPEIPNYQTGTDVEKLFESLPRVNGLVDDAYLHTLAVIAINS